MSRRDSELRSQASESRWSSWRVNILSIAFVISAISRAVIAICFVYTLVVVVPELVELGWAIESGMGSIEGGIESLADALAEEGA